MTLAEALRAAALEPREARILLAEVTGLSPAVIVASAERSLAPELEQRFHALAARRRAGEPVAYLVGRQEFYSLDFEVSPAVLIPRPETELLVELALARKPASVLDLGTGSGAIALAIKRNLPAARVIATEASAAALAVARRNAVGHALAVEFRHGRWFEPLAGERFDLIVSNPPYVAAGDPHLASLAFEPREALVSGADGLDAIREIAREAAGFLHDGGWLLLEHGIGQDDAVRSLLGAAGLEAVQTWPDLAGIPRVTGGRR